MRSYYAHLTTTAPKPKDSAVEARPVLRTSAIFPVIHEEGISSRILFMGYWMLKRNITELNAIVTLRALSGNILARKTMRINEAKAFRIELSALLELAHVPLDVPFFGSLEIEFYSIVNLVFPFPAVVINYYGPTFSSVVHTAQRVYNDYEDMKNNSQTSVPESGFNIYKDAEREPFLAVINGGQLVRDAKMQFTFYNSQGQVLPYTLSLGDLAPYQTHFIFPAREVPLEKFLGGAPGSCKVQFQVAWVFPRLVVGNFLYHPPGMVITHTYYDCTHATEPSNYWIPSNPDFYPESLMVPLIHSKKNLLKSTFIRFILPPILW